MHSSAKSYCQYNPLHCPHRRGDITISEELIKKIKACSYIIGVDRGITHILAFNENCTLKIDSGEVLVILDSYEESVPSLDNVEENCKFFTDIPAAHLFDYLAQHSLSSESKMWGSSLSPFKE